MRSSPMHLDRERPPRARGGALGAVTLAGAVFLAGPAEAQGVARALSTTLGRVAASATGAASAAVAPVVSAAATPTADVAAVAVLPTVVGPVVTAATTPVVSAATNAANNVAPTAAISPVTGIATGAVNALGGTASLRGTVDAAGALAGNVVQVVPTTLSGNTTSVSALNGPLLNGSALNGSALNGTSALNGASALDGNSTLSGNSALNGISALNGSLDGTLSGTSVLNGNGTTQTTNAQTTNAQTTNAQTAGTQTTLTNTQVANDARTSGTGGGTRGAGSGPVQIVNVAAGTGADSAVNLAQLDDALARVPLRGTNTSNLAVSVASGADALAVGYGAQAGGAAGLAVGTNAVAGGTNAVAVGANASANQANAVAIGAGARTTRAGQVAIGTASSTYTLAGLPSDAGRAAQSGPTQFVTTDAAGNLAGSGYGPSSIAALSNRVDAIGQYAAETRREAREGVATALAMPTASMPSALGRTSWVANSATYRGAWAGGVGLAHRLPTPMPLAVTVGYAYGGDGSHGVRAGLGGEF